MKNNVVYILYCRNCNTRFVVDSKPQEKINYMCLKCGKEIIHKYKNKEIAK